MELNRMARRAERRSPRPSRPGKHDVYTGPISSQTHAEDAAHFHDMYSEISHRNSPVDRVLWPAMIILERGRGQADMEQLCNIIRTETGVSKVHFTVLRGTEVAFFGLPFDEAGKSLEMIKILTARGLEPEFQPTTVENC